MTKILTIATLLTAFAPPALAAPAKPPAVRAAPKEVPRAALQARLDARFTQIDTDKNGALSRPEIDAAHSKFVGLTKAAVSTEIRQEFAATDANKDGQATVEEMTAATPAEGRAGVPTALAKLDSNKDGKLSLAEFAAAVPAPPLGSTDDFLARFDADKDGKVSAAEYRGPGLAAFDQLDANKDGKVSAAERQAARSAVQGR